MKKQELQTQVDELQKQLNVLSEKIANCKDEPKIFPQKTEEIQLAKQRVAHRIAVLNDGWVPDWSDTSLKFAILRTNGVFTTRTYQYTKQQPDWLYCKSEEVAQQIIEECRYDLILIFSE